MALMKALIDRLPSLRKSQEFRSIIPELQDRLSVVEAEADDLKSELEDALFDGAEKLTAVKNKVAANQAEQEELRIAIAGAERRQQEAAAAELAADLEGQAKNAKKTQLALLSQYVELEQHFSEAAKLLGDIQAKESELQSFHALMNHHKRPDLVVRGPWFHLSSIFGDKIVNRVGEYPSHHTIIPGYFPYRHPDGPALARIKELKL